MLKTETKEIDGLQFTVVQFAATYGLTLLMRVAKTIGPAAAMLGELRADTDLGVLGPQLGGLLSALDVDDTKKLLLEILKCSSVWLDDATGGRKIEFTDQKCIDQVFSGRLLTMFKVAVFALQVNFQDFLDGISKSGKLGPAGGPAPTSA